MTDLVNTLVSGLVGLGSGTGGALLLRARSDVRKTNADTGSVISEAAMELLQPYREDLAAARVEIQALRTEVAGARDEIRELRDQNHAYRELYGPLPDTPPRTTGRKRT